MTSTQYDPARGGQYSRDRQEQRRRWDSLCVLLDMWLERAIPLSAELDAAALALATFPDDVRIAPDHWFMEVAYSEWLDTWTAWTVRVGSVTRILEPPHPAWKLVRMIVLQHELSDALIQEAFCAFPGMTHICGLVLIRMPDHLMLDEHFFQRLIGSSGFKSLHYLRSVGHSLNDRVLEFLAGWPGADQLMMLELDTSTFSTRAIQALVTSPHLRALEVLRLNAVTIPLP